MINRKLSEKISYFLTKFPIVTLVGVRQCGKSTLLKNQLPDWEYVSLEDPDIRQFAEDDPRGFLKEYSNCCIFDEIQRTPNLFSYIQTKVDSENKMGQYVLSGSHNFNLMEKISQSLVGRTAILTLAPFSISELEKSNLITNDIEEIIYKGFYPAIYDRKIEPNEYFPSYISTYIERDVRLIQNISNANTFIKFLKLLAIRSGQILNYTELSNEVGISTPTVKSWISILIQSYIIYELHPYFSNISKRIVKSPKIYFYDVGLLSHLLGINQKEEIKKHTLFGNLFETMIVSEYIKQQYFNAITPNISFYRDSNQFEVDLIDESESEKKAYEIKARETMDRKYLKNLNKISQILNIKSENLTCIYTGEKTVYGEKGNFVNYKDMFCEKI